MGVKLWEGGFRSHHAAEMAGKQALEDLLNGLVDRGSFEIHVDLDRV